MIESLIDYRGDSARNSSGGGKSYSADYSPNNIRTVIISPNGVLVRLHKSIKNWGKGSYNTVTFNSKDLYAAEQEKGYKPVFNLLTRNMTSSIEEIIILTKDASGIEVQGSFLSEFSVEALVKGYNNGADLQTRVQNRFGRLRYFTFLDITFPYFLQGWQQSEDLRKTQFITEFKGLETFKNYSSTELASADEYWKHWGNQNQAYKFDNTLSTYFNEIKMQKEGELKKAEISKMKESASKTEMKEAEELLEKFAAVFKTSIQFCNTVKKCGLNGVVSEDTFKPYKLSLKFKSWKELNRTKFIELITEPKPVEFKEAKEYNKNLMQKLMNELLKHYCNLFITSLAGISEITLKTILSREMQLKNHYYIDSSLVNEKNYIQKCSKSSIESASLTTKSFQMAIWTYCLLFLDRSSENYSARYIAADTWKGDAKS